MMPTTGVEQVDAILASVPMFADAADATAEQLSGGLTNVSYLATVDGDPFVVRIAGGNTEILGIDREREAAAVRNASAAGIAPETIAFLLPEGSSVTRYLSDAREITLDEARSAEHLERKAELLRRIHDLPAIDGIFDPYADIERWLAIVDERGIGRPRRLEQLLHRVNRVRLDRMLALDASVMCHNDAYHLNVLADGERLWMIDWEYAGMGDPMWDLAATAFELPSNGKDLLLTAYFGETSDDLRASLDDMIAVFLAWNAAWSLIQDHESEVDYDYTAYADQLLNLVPPER